MTRPKLEGREWPRAFVFDSVRTVFGKYRGGLSGIRVDDLAAIPLAALCAKHPDVAETRVEDIFFGNANGAGEDNRNVARMAALLAGLPYSTPAVTINRLCGSGGESVVQAARAVRSGDLDCVIAGGVEGMSRAPFILPKAGEVLPRVQQLEATTVGWRMVNPKFPSHWTASLGACVETTAARMGITRAEQDEWAVRSHTLADKSWRSGLVGVVEAVEGLDRDESIRPESTLESLDALPPAFADDGTLTAGNSSPINDGAAAMLIGSDAFHAETGIEPLGEILSSQIVAVEPHEFALAPALAVNKLLARNNLDIKDIEIIEVNEAFAAVVLAFLREFPGLDPARVNTNGGAIAFGHPLGASMTRVISDTITQLRHRGGGLGIATACIGVGQGLAVLIGSE